MCTDARGRHWTALGDYEFCLAMRGSGRGRGLTGNQMSEFPMDAFRPEWLVEGWIDEWARISQEQGHLDVYAWGAWA